MPKTTEELLDLLRSKIETSLEGAITADDVLKVAQTLATLASAEVLLKGARD